MRIMNTVFKFWFCFIRRSEFKLWFAGFKLQGWILARKSFNYWMLLIKKNSFMCIIPKTVLIANVKIWTVYCFVCRVNFQALIGWGAKTKACKPIINQVKKIQFDYAAGVSAYSDSVSAYGDRDCFSRCIYFFLFCVFRK